MEHKQTDTRAGSHYTEMQTKKIDKDFTSLTSQLSRSDTGHALWKETGEILEFNGMPVLACPAPMTGKPKQGYINATGGLSAYSDSGARHGRQPGFSPTAAGEIPIAVFSSSVKLESIPEGATDEKKTEVRKRNYSSLLKSLAPHLIVKVGATPAREQVEPLTKPEIIEAAKKAAKAAGVKYDTDFMIDFMNEPANRTKTVQIAAVEPQTVCLADLAEKQGGSGKIKLSPAEITEAVTEISRQVRDAFRMLSE